MVLLSERGERPSRAGAALRVGVLLFALFLLQGLVVSRLPAEGLRADLLVAAMFGAAVELSPALGLVFAVLFGYVADVFSGRFWGFHIASYVATVSLVSVTGARVEFRNPAFQAFLVGLCSLGQSAALGVYLWLRAPGEDLPLPLAGSLGVRAAVMTALGPLIVALVGRVAGRGRARGRAGPEEMS